MTWPTHLNPTQWTEDSSHLLHLPSLLLSHSQPARVPKAALRAPQGDQQQTPSRLSHNRGLTALCPQVNCPLGYLDPGSSGSWRSLTSQLSASGLPCTFPPTPSANARIPGSPFNQESAPATRERKQRGGCTEFTVKLELFLMGALLTVPAHGEEGSLGQGVLLGVLGTYRPDAGPSVLFPRKRSSDGLFLEKYLSDVTWSK